MKKILLTSLTLAVIALFAVQKAGAYCIYYNNADPQLRSKDTPVLKVWVFKSKKDWEGLELGKKIKGIVNEAVQTGGPAVQAASVALGQPEVGIAVGIAVPLAEPLGNLAAKIHQLAVIKAIHTFGPTEASACWNWADIEKAKAGGPNRSLYAVVFDQSNNNYLGEFDFDYRGYVRLQVNKKEDGTTELAVARIDYDPNAKDPKYPYKLRDAKPEGAKMLHTF